MKCIICSYFLNQIWNVSLGKIRIRIQGLQTGKMEYLIIDREEKRDVFKVANSKVCKHTKWREFEFQFIDRIAVTKRERFRYVITTEQKST